MEYELMNEVGLLVSSQRPIPVILEGNKIRTWLSSRYNC
ncbi:MAG TPA: hypothetical protein VFZ42_02295 [Chitinophagaceae bacterium]